jgi:hypothetical protein
MEKPFLVEKILEISLMLMYAQESKSLQNK